MNERELWWKISLVAALLTIGFFAIYPVEQRIKFGIDLRGGYSLTYEIDTSGLDAHERKGIAERVMQILKERVDPNGVLNLVWRPVGDNRIEIQMPRPPESVSAARDKYVVRRDQLVGSTIRRGDVALALNRAGSERDQALDKLLRGVPARRELLKSLARAFDDLKAAESGSQDTDALEKAYDRAFDAVLATNLELGRLETAINSDPKQKFRKEEIEKLKTEHKDLAKDVDETVALYDEWHKLRGKEGSLDDPADLQRLLRGAGVLEFRLLAEPNSADESSYAKYVESLKKHGPRRSPEDTMAWFPIENPEYFFKKSTKELEQQFEAQLKRLMHVCERFGDKYYVLGYIDPRKCLAQDKDNNWQLKAAVPTRDEQGRPAVSFRLDERGGDKFQTLTSQNVRKMLCFFLDGMAVSAATINSAIRTNGIITGQFTNDEVQRLCQKLNAGSLPRKLKEPPISIQGIGPSLGEANRSAGQRAALYGCIAVGVFMILWYRYSGLIAVMAVALNLLLTAAVMASLSATLNLAGIAGLVLAVGMAVDANVLINERIHEELRNGASMKMAIKLGYEKAFSAILDSNVTTILSCVILYWLGSEEIKGFALTLGWGVVISMGTAVYVTRYYFEYMDINRIPSEVHKYPLMLASGCAVFGGLLWGLGHALTIPELRAESVSIFFGQALVGVLPATLIVLASMMIMRAIHKSHQQRKPNDLPMLRLIGVPKTDWFAKRRVFFAISLVTTIGGAIMFLARPEREKYDIEFLGGTSVQIDLKPDRIGRIKQEQIEEKLKAARAEIGELADKIDKAANDAAGITTRGTEYVISAAGVPKDRLANIITAQLSDQLPLGGVREEGPGTVIIRLKDGAKFKEGSKSDIEPSVDTLRPQIHLAAQRARTAALNIAESQVQAVSGVGGSAEKSATFEIVTRETSRELVVDAILSQLRQDLDIQPSLTFTMRADPTRDNAKYFPMTNDDLGKVIGDNTITERVPDALGGVAIIVESINPPQSIASLKKRLRDMRLQPSQANVGWRQQSVIGLTQAGGAPVYSRVALLTTDENLQYEEGAATTAMWRDQLAETELKLAQEAMERQTSLGKVTQFAPQVAEEAKVRAYGALVLSWIGIIVYLWFRFGSVTWGLAAVIALVHDALVAIGFVALSYFISITPIGTLLGVQNFRIDMAVVAALLTIIGYSVNDTIVVFDRIRENRGKLKDVTAQLVNDSINQTLSRTILTVTTVMITIIIMYIWGGQGIHGFNYAMFIGIMTGCYSSIAVASPLLVILREKAARRATALTA